MAVELATAYVTLIPSARGISAGIKSELAGAEMQRVAAQSGEEMSGSFARGFKAVGGALVAVGLAAALASAVKGAANFQSATELLVTAGGEAQSALGSVRDGIKSIAVETGTSTGQLSEGMYTLEKAGLRGAAGLGVLRVAAEGARAENVDLGTMTNALTSILRSYNLPASQATQVTNQLVAASGAAKTTMQEFAGSLSTVLPVASAAGLSFAQVGGAIATLTSHGTSAQEATQELANTIRGLQAPSAVASHEMAQFGLNSNTVALNLGKRGLTGTLDDLTHAITSRMGPAGTVLLNAFNQSSGATADMRIEMSKMPPSMQKLATAFAGGQLSMSQWRKDARALPVDQRLMMQGFMATYTQAHKFNDLLTSGSPAAQTYAAALEKMLGGATGLNTALMLTGGSSATFSKNVAAIGAAGSEGGRNISTWAKTQGTFNVQMGRLKEVAQTTAITVGSSLLPKLTAFGGWIANHLGAVKTSAVVVGALGAAMLVGAVAAKGIAAAEGVYSVLTGEATAKTGLQVIALVAQKVAMAAVSVATKTWAAAQWLLNVAMDANPIALIVIGIAALVAGIIYAYTHIKSFRNAVKEVFDFLKKWGPLILLPILPMVAIPLLIVQHWTRVVEVFKTIGGTLSNAASAIGSAVSGFFEKLPGRILALLAALPHLLAQAAEDAIAGFVVGLAYAAIGIWDFFTKLIPKAIVLLASLGARLFGLGVSALGSMASGIATGAVAVWGFFTAAPGRILALLKALGSDLLHLGWAALTSMASGIATGAVAVWGFFTALPGRIVSGLVSLGTLLIHDGLALINGLGTGTGEGWKSLVSWFENLPTTIGNLFHGAVNWLFGAGEQIMHGLLNGITSGLNAVKGFVGGIASKIVSWKGPPAYDATILIGNGQLIMQGLMAGISSQLPALRATLGDVTAAVAGGVGTGQGSTLNAATAPLSAAATARTGPAVGSITVTAYNPAEAAAKTAAEIGWLQLTRGQ